MPAGFFAVCPTAHVSFRKLEVAIWGKCDKIYALSIKKRAVNKKRNEHTVWTALSQPHGRKTRFMWL